MVRTFVHLGQPIPFALSYAAVLALASLQLNCVFGHRPSCW